MGAPHPIKCPSGLAGEVRGLKTKEANLLAQMQTRSGNTGLDQLLSNCWVTTSDPGPYKPNADGSLDWTSVLVCDRFYALLAIRIATYGAAYEFSVQCPACRAKVPWEIDLGTDLKVKALPKESTSTFATGARMESAIPGMGRRFWFRLPTGADEAKAAKAARGQDKDRIMTIAIAQRIDQIDGVEPVEKLRFLDELDLGDATDLIALLDAADGGVETDIEIECDKCGQHMEIALPFGREFWLPQKRK